MSDTRLRRYQSLIVNLRDDGTARIWRKSAKDNFELSAETFKLLFAFGQATTVREAAAAAGWKEGRELSAAIEHFVDHGLLVSTDAPPPGAREDAPRAVDVSADRVFSSLVDPGSLAEDVAGVAETLTATAAIDGRPVVLVASDGATGDPVKNLEKVLKAQDRAFRQRCPMVWICTEVSAAAAASGPPNFEVLDETPYFCGPQGMGRIYSNQVKLSGVVPQVTVLLGEALMPVAFPAALGDGLVMLEGSFMGLAQPEIVKHFLGEEVSRDALGGASMHCSVSGTGDEIVKTKEDALKWAKRFLSYLPSHCGELPPIATPCAPDGSIEGVIPNDPDIPFDVRTALRGVVDGGSLLEIKRKYAPELTTAFARIDGKPVGIIASNSHYGGGILRVESCTKGARFISVCDAFNVPLVFLADVPGFLIGSRSEQGGIVRAAAKLFSAICQATVPKIAVVLRKAHTGALYAMCGPPFDPDAFIAIAGASISIFGRKGELELADEAGVDADALKSLRMPAAVESILDAVVLPAGLRAELGRRLRQTRTIPPSQSKKRVVPPM